MINKKQNYKNLLLVSDYKKKNETETSGVQFSYLVGAFLAIVTYVRIKRVYRGEGHFFPQLFQYQILINNYFKILNLTKYL